MGLGLLIILLGIIIAPLPGPFGVPIMVVGLVLILRTSFAAKRGFLRAVKRYPKLLNPIRRLLRRNPPFAQVFWQQLLRVERLVTSKGHRGVARMRKRAKAAFRGRPVWQAA
ncbi:MAG: hypothetical protein KF842_09525 [Caulobacter sp.]|nr:hypothetical protein [Caulobacter sp.]